MGWGGTNGRDGRNETLQKVVLNNKIRWPYSRTASLEKNASRITWREVCQAISEFRHQGLRKRKAMVKYPISFLGCWASVVSETG